MDRRVRVREVDRRAARSAHPPRPHPRNERRQLSPQTEQATTAADVTPASGQLATVLTAGKVRCSPCSRYCAWLCSSHPLRCAPWLGGCRSGRESRLIDRTGKLSLDVTALNRATPPSQPVMYSYSGRRCNFSLALTATVLAYQEGFVAAIEAGDGLAAALH